MVSDRYMCCKEYRLSSEMIQMIRGMAILLVSFHHALSRVSDRGILGQLIYVNINYVHVVLFFVVAGYLFEFKKEKYYSQGKTFIFSKIKRLILPYLSWSTIIYIIVSIGLRFEVLVPIINKLGFSYWSIGEFVFNTFTFSDSYIELLWFLYTLFFIFIFNFFIRDYLLSWIGIVFLIIGGSVIQTFIPDIYIIDKIVLHLPNFLLGRLIFKKNYETVLRGKLWILLASFAIALLFNVEYYIGFSFVSTFSFLQNFYRNFHSFTQGLVLAFLLVALLLRFENCKKRFIIIKQGLILLGNYSMPIYLIHNPWIVGVLATLLVEFNLHWIFVSIICVSIGCIVPIIIKKYIINRSDVLNLILFGESSK